MVVSEGARRVGDQLEEATPFFVLCFEMFRNFSRAPTPRSLPYAFVLALFSLFCFEFLTSFLWLLTKCDSIVLFLEVLQMYVRS